MITESLSNKETKLVKILKKLSTPQITKLRKLVVSPYFHHTKGVANLFDYLKKYHPNFPPQKVSNEVIAQRLFPNMSNGAKKIKNYKSDLMKLVEKFLILEQAAQQEHQQKFLLAQVYQDLQLQDLTNSTIKKLQQSLEQSTVKGLPYYYQKLQLAHFQYYDLDLIKTSNKQKPLQNLLDQLDHYFILAKYKYAHEASERMAKLNEEFELRFLEEVQVEATKNNLLNKQLPFYYYHQLQEFPTHRDYDETSFESFKQSFLENHSYLYIEDQQAIFISLINYVTKFLNSGAAHLTQTLLDLYKDGVNNNLLTSRNRISETSFINIVIVATKCKAFDWADHFILSHRNYLHLNVQEDVLKITKALVLFNRQQTEEALDIIGSSKFKNDNLELYCLPLEVKCMFEICLYNTSYHDTTISRLNSLTKQFSMKSHFAKKKENGYQAFIHFVKQLVKTINKTKGAPSLKETKSQIISTERLIHKAWLLEKCEQLIDKRKTKRKRSTKK